MRSPRARMALALAAALGCGGADAPTYWVGERGAARVLEVSAGAAASVAVSAPALDAPVRALAARADGTVLVLQEVSGGAPPGVVVGREGRRRVTLASTDETGAPLFDASEPPWAAAEAADGRLWVTGRAAPAIFDADGAFVRRAAPLPFATRGVAALPDGRVLVTYGAGGAAAYAPDGASVEPLAVSFGPTYSGVDAVAVRPDGGIVLAVLRHGAVTEGVLVDVALGPGTLAATGDPEGSARLPGLPSAIVAGVGEVVAGPALGSLAPPACAIALSPDLREVRGCVAPGAHRGVVRAW